jgi:hypothetical protein
MRNDDEAIEAKIARREAELAALGQEIADLYRLRDEIRRTYIDAVGTTGGKATVATIQKKMP